MIIINKVYIIVSNDDYFNINCIFIENCQLCLIVQIILSFLSIQYSMYKIWSHLMCFWVSYWILNHVIQDNDCYVEACWLKASGANGQHLKFGTSCHLTNIKMITIVYKNCVDSIIFLSLMLKTAVVITLKLYTGRMLTFWH